MNFLGVSWSLTEVVVVAEVEESREQQIQFFRCTFDFVVEFNCGGGILSSAVDAIPLILSWGSEGFKECSRHGRDLIEYRMKASGELLSTFKCLLL